MNLKTEKKKKSVKIDTQNIPVSIKEIKFMA